MPADAPRSWRGDWAERIDYDELVGVYAFLQTDSNDTRTMVEAARDGWWYSSYCRTQDSSPRSWATRNRAARRRLQAFWLQQLDMTYTFGGWTVRIAWGTCARSSEQLSHDPGRRTLAGDRRRRHGIRSLSSQGLYNALGPRSRRRAPSGTSQVIRPD
jgi:hypothetical protein